MNESTYGLEVGTDESHESHESHETEIFVALLLPFPP